LGKADWVGAEALKIGTAPAIPLHYSETLRQGAQDCGRLPCPAHLVG